MHLPYLGHRLGQKIKPNRIDHPAPKLALATAAAPMEPAYLETDLHRGITATMVHCRPLAPKNPKRVHLFRSEKSMGCKIKRPPLVLLEINIRQVRYWFYKIKYLN